ncbi:MAG TPA: (deoxy)nucleoside triphosphate pyrophosphohydrolase [Prolixibacteraceae bacterium]|nr:(deoxy)nucleoside triphosphate pyrophosphohydrolase [Bacteroidales bacterium]HNZ71042.1 (deoxy)nucleoside triphosphate pyrophosphohydrolase [Prolixibacteraceae bacterium]HPB05834.1 (deoxy)nucleoside triphosphate pyrophosphohydrolase [Prolixibacteraceae bacterium]HQN93392.1 (deoxy)nucleoside triphosphate pyrophosphohydrolase [Prolixibacteraceae bacterium]HUM88721.1 (deoxy)nucleoside triphosphate pyrophosphohydrolase [Prolixibacteraceae bacterium]
MIAVTCAIIVRNDTILACQRRPNSSHPYEWEFPGGKQENYESPEECIIREIWEELRVEIEIIKPLTPVSFSYPEQEIYLMPFLCQITAGNPTPVEHHTIRWQRISMFSDLKWSDADAEIFRINEDNIL